MCTVTIRNWLLDIVIATFYRDFYGAWSWFLLSLSCSKRIFKFIDDFMLFIDQSAALTCSAAIQCSDPMGKDSRQGPRQKTKVSRAQASSSTQKKTYFTALAQRSARKARRGNASHVPQPTALPRPRFATVLSRYFTSPSSRSSCATFDLSRVYPAAHKLQKLEMERFLAAARRVRKRYVEHRMSEEVRTRFLQVPTRHLRRLVYFELGKLSWRQDLLLREELENGAEKKPDEIIENEASIVEAINSVATAPTGATASDDELKEIDPLLAAWIEELEDGFDDDNEIKKKHKKQKKKMKSSKGGKLDDSTSPALTIVDDSNDEIPLSLVKTIP